MHQTDTLPHTVKLQGATNFRDLGGWRTTTGGHVRFGQVFRSDAPHRLTDADLATIAELGIRTVCDLRGAREVERMPSRLAALPGIEIHACPIEPTVGGSLRDILRTRDATGEDVHTLLRRAYVAYALECSARYHPMFDLLLGGHAPLLFHCTAGKDRTGFGAALLLSALGVAWDDIMQDYMATNRLWKPDSVLADRLPDDVAQTLLRVHEEMLDAAFAALKREYGSTDRYLERVLGLDATARERLREMLVA